MRPRKPGEKKTSLVKKPVKAPWYDALPVKVEKVTDKGNVVCKKISKKDLAAVKAAGYSVKKMPNGSYVICHK